MSAEIVYEAIREAIQEQVDLDPSLTMFELLGAIRMIDAEFAALALEPDDDDDEEDVRSDTFVAGLC